MNEKTPVRRAVKHLIARLGVGSFGFRYAIEAVPRMHYAYIMYEAAKLAVKLGQQRISVVEFGVAGGNGLLWMERHAEAIERILPVTIEIYGFDTGAGLPEPRDYRDLPYHWQAGFFSMDQQLLPAKLSRAKLVLGDVAETLRDFEERFSPAPIAAVAHDMDFYSSTAAGLKLFDLPSASLMPRIFCYFDDTIGSEIELYSDFTGQRLAIKEFNAAHDRRKIAVPYHLRARDGWAAWRQQIWICHLFDHPAYDRFVGQANQQLPLAVS